jgi:iron complex transport system substrate-binding protein
VITLDHKPERIIASASEASGLLAYGIRPVGIFVATDLQYELGPGNGFDLEGIEIVGEEWGHIDAEKAAELAPDLIVADWWPPQDAYQGFEEGVDQDSLKVKDLAPVIGASQQGSLEDVVAWYEGFAESLGVDVDSGEYAAGRARFEEAVEGFEAAVAAKPGLTALAVAPAEDMLYVAVPEFSTSLTDFKDWGLAVIDPDSPQPDFPYWEYLSWENADKYQPDLLLVDDRGYDDNVALGEAQPTWTKIVAADAKAYASWPGFWVHTYAAYAGQLEQLTASITAANPDIGA